MAASGRSAGGQQGRHGGWASPPPTSPLPAFPFLYAAPGHRASFVFLPMPSSLPMPSLARRRWRCVAGDAPTQSARGRAAAVAVGGGTSAPRPSDPAAHGAVLVVEREGEREAEGDGERRGGGRQRRRTSGRVAGGGPARGGMTALDDGVWRVCRPSPVLLRGESRPAAAEGCKAMP